MRFCEGSSLSAGVSWSAMRGRRLAGSSSPVRPPQPVTVQGVLLPFCLAGLR